KNLPLSIFESFVLQLDKKGKLENEPFIQLAELSLKQNKISKAELLSQKVLSRDRSCKRALEVIQKIHKKTPLDLNLISNPAGLRTGLTDYPMKILLVSNFFPPQGFGEYGRFMAALSKVLSERGHQLYVLTANQVQHGEKPVRERGIFRSLSLNGGWQDGKVFTLPEVRSRNIDSKNQAILRTHIRAFTPDVCLLGNIQFLGVSLLKEILNHQIPVIHYITGNSPAYAAKDQPLSPLYFKAVTSKNALTELHESKFSMDHTDVIIPGAMVDFYNFEKEPSFDKLKIAFIDGIQIESGLHLLINSLASLKNSGLNFSCEVAGPVIDDNYLNQIKSFLIDNELIEKVKFSRGVNPAGIREVLARSNTFVYPSTETCASGISLIEAMAAGLTVISSSTGNSEEIIEDGVNGLLFSPNDNQTLTEKLLLAAKNKKLARALAKQGQFDAVNEFNITDSALKLEEDFRYLKTFCEPIFLK
ncbi:MAG: glycosyltransferase family 4 protein, partial [Lentisphaeraceae bacterium]|nr:glycosyltransferase family 4 protein [Lentisphaeraceae bacterium]